MAYQLISVVEYPFTSDDLRCPSIDDDGSLIVGADERVLWAGTAVVRVNFHNGKIWKEAWKAPEPALVVLTEERFAYSIAKFDKGSTYMGGLVIDTAIMTAVSKMRAAGRRKGRVATGQLLHRWAIDLTLFKEKGMVKRTQSLAAFCKVDDVQHLLILDLSPEHAQRIAPIWAKAIARRRLAACSDLSDEDRERLSAIESQPKFQPNGTMQEITFPRTLKVGFD